MTVQAGSGVVAQGAWCCRNYQSVGLNVRQQRQQFMCVMECFEEEHVFISQIVSKDDFLCS